VFGAAAVLKGAEKGLTTREIIDLCTGNEELFEE
jgi:hypothetical protein